MVTKKKKRHYEFVDLSIEVRHGERSKERDKWALFYIRNINCDGLCSLE